MEIKNIEFELFRYQLLPVTTHVIEDMFHEIKSTDDVRKNKNKFFLGDTVQFSEACS